TPTWTETATATATASSTVTASYTHTPSATPSNTASPAGQATLTATPTATTCSAGFSDVSSSDYFYEAVGWLYCHGAISGYGDGTFRPYNLLTRGQMCKITVLGFGLTVWSPPTCNFVDCSSAYQPYIETLYHAGVVSGYDCGAGCLEFRPNANVTRGQVAKIVTLTGITFRGWPILDPIGATFRDVPAGSPFYSYVETAYCHGLISGYSCGGQAEPCPGLYFRPNGSTTRGQVSKIVYGGTLSGPACGSRGGRR
ncbi:MAG: S-layer homology domain-containing protein, partial [Chloroflexia bacterium]